MLEEWMDKMHAYRVPMLYSEIECYKISKKNGLLY
jgi:hypothetical protein